MIQLQVISKLLNTQDYSFVEDNLLTVEHFVGYEEEFKFIADHYTRYGNVPDKVTFLTKFPTVELVDVTESDRYLLETLREEYLFYKSVPIVQKVADLLQTDANVAAEYMISQMRNIEPTYTITAKDIVSSANDRYDKYIERKDKQDEWFFTTGFEELDDIIHGIQREEEFFVIVARTNQGKSWILEKIVSHVWQLGFNVGYVSPEMSADSIGYRFDTLTSKFSNKGLMWGKSDVQDAEYKTYIDGLKSNKNKFVVATPQDFDRQITITRLKSFIKQYKLDLIAIDGITYITDERGKRGDNKTTSLTNISEDLMGLSMELGVPVLVVVQANRSGAMGKEIDDGTPELESIRDSDGIAHNASKVIAIRQKNNGVLEIGIKKQRFGMVGGKLNYQWDIDKGDFTFIPSYDDAQPRAKTEKKVRAVKKKYEDAEDVF